MARSYSESLIFKGIAVGEPFPKVIGPSLPDGTPLGSQRRVEIALVWDPRTGDLTPCRYQPGKFPFAGDFPQIRLEDTGPLREQMTRRDITTVRKGGASRKYLDVDEMVKARGGDPDYRIPLPPSSFFTKDWRK